ncbi:recombinase family protein [Sphingomonas sp. Leaf4]|uniref:recombinase family protein n=1 Tax=Sphingomonas sp. Leaf4 TaxID=2876553 RepID=UPI001E32924A|nr:recombinase family protein [Sphingomonas sp. Leaf4]
MPRCAIYARFSSDLQSANSAEDQIAMCSARAEREGWEVAGVYTDIAISGASNRRPGMTAMLTDAGAGAFDVVCAEAIDRIARNQADIATIYQRLEFANVRIHTLSEGDVSELHIGLKGTMSALFLKDLADKIRRGQRGTVSRGRVPGGLAYGYDVVPAIRPDGELDRGLRRINPEQAAVVLRIYREYSTGRGPKAIARGLNEDGIPAPRGGDWRASAIAGSRARGLGVLHNPIYAGQYLYNRLHMRRDPETRRRVSRVNPASERVLVEMPELRIVPQELWQLVQDQAAERSTGPLVQRKRPKHLLSGIVMCGVCGGAYAMIGGGRMACTRAREAGTCDVTRTVARSMLEARVLKGVAEHLLQPEAVSVLVQEYHSEIETKRKDRTRDAADLDRQIGKAEAQVQRLIAAIADGAADFTDVREALTARKADVERYRREKAEVEAIPVIALNPGIVDSYRRRVRGLSATLDAGTPSGDEVKSRLRDLIERVKVTPDNHGGFDIEVLSSFGAVVALATDQNRRDRTSRSVMMVAKEGFEPPTPGL